MKHKLLVLFLCCCAFAYGQKPYFVDGFHGGVYGHYPLWVSQFLVDSLAKYPEWRVGLEIEPETWDVAKAQDAKGYAGLKTIMYSPAVDVTNPTFAQPYAYNISGESLIRQFQYGIKKWEEHFPGIQFSTYAVQEPCFTSCMPQLLKLLGFRYAVLKNPNTAWGGYTRNFGGQFVRWIGSDGTAIPAVPRYYSEAFEANSTWQTKAWANSDDYIQTSYAQGIPFPVGTVYQDAGWKNGPWLGRGDKIKGKSIYTTWTNYFQEHFEERAAIDWKLQQEDIRVNLMWGSQVLQKIAQQVRHSEYKLIATEKLSAMAKLDHGFTVDQNLFDQAWRTVLLAQHHDSWIVPYNKLDEKQTWAQAIAGWTASADSIADLVQQLVKDSYQQHAGKRNERTDLGTIRLFNGLGYARKEYVAVEIPAETLPTWVQLVDCRGEKIEISQTRVGSLVQISFVAEVPSFGYASYALKAGKEPRKTSPGIHFDSDGNCHIETPWYRLVLDKNRGGVFKQLIAKQLGNTELIDTQSAYSFGELSGHFYDKGQFYASTDAPVRFIVLEDSPLRKLVEIHGEIAGHPFKQLISLYSHQPQIDFQTTLDWQYNEGIGAYKQTESWTANVRAFTNDKFKLKVLFPTCLKDTKVYKNAPFDVQESKLKDTFFDSWDQIKNNVILDWVDVFDMERQQGLALFSDHTTSYIHGEDYPLGLTLQYSGIGLWGVDYQLKGASQVAYAILPHAGDWEKAKIAQSNANRQEPLIAFYGDRLTVANRSFMAPLSDGLILSSVQTTNDALLVRLFNTQHKDLSTGLKLQFPHGKVAEVDLKGKLLQGDLSGATHGIPIQLSRFGLQTLTINY